MDFLVTLDQERELYLQAGDLINIGYDREEIMGLQHFQNLNWNEVAVYVGVQEGFKKQLSWQRWYFDHLDEVARSVLGWAKFCSTVSVARQYACFLENLRGSHNSGSVTLLWGPVGDIVSQAVSVLGAAQGEVPTGGVVIQACISSESEPEDGADIDDYVPLATTRNQRKINQGVELGKRQRGRPRKIKVPPVEVSVKRPRGRPKKLASKLEEQRLGEAGELMLVDLHGPEGVQTRARRAYIRSMQAGMLFDCPEEVAIEGLASYIRECSRV